MIGPGSQPSDRVEGHGLGRAGASELAGGDGLSP